MRPFGALLVLGLCWPGLAAAESPSLQDLVDDTPENGTLVPPPGVYAGPLILEFPLTIDGQGQVTIDNGGHGTVIYVDTDGASKSTPSSIHPNRRVIIWASPCLPQRMLVYRL